MLGAVAGDIIGSPYEWNNTNDRYFELCRGTRGWSRGHEVTYHPRFTYDTIMTLAVARWLMSDKDRNASRLIEIMQSMGREYIDRGFAPMFRRWIKGAEAMAQAIWMAGHGRSKDDIRFAMTHDFGYDLDMPEEDMKALLAGCVKEPVIVNGEDIGQFYFRETGRIDSSCQNTVSAAIRAFLAGDGFEDCVRRAVTYGGDSDTIASMAGAIAAPFYGGVPEKITGMCNVYLDSQLRSLMESFENNFMLRKATGTIKVEQKKDDSFKIIKAADRKIYVAPSYRKDLIEALKARFGEDIRIIKPSELPDVIMELSKQEKDGTYLEDPRPDVRTIYFQDGEFKTSATMTGDALPSQKSREESRRNFLDILDYARKTKSQLQQTCGYHGDGSIHFANAYYPEIFSDRGIWKGDIFAGSVGIDPSCGLLRINHGGDFGPMEWFGERTDSVFDSVSPDSSRSQSADIASMKG